MEHGCTFGWRASLRREEAAASLDGGGACLLRHDHSGWAWPLGVAGGRDRPLTDRSTDRGQQLHLAAEQVNNSTVRFSLKFDFKKKTTKWGYARIKLNPPPGLFLISSTCEDSCLLLVGLQKVSASKPSKHLIPEYQQGRWLLKDVLLTPL